MNETTKQVIEFCEENNFPYALIIIQKIISDLGSEGNDKKT